MKYIVEVMAILGLLLTVIPSFFVWYGYLSWDIHTQSAFVGMVLWFIFAPIWLRKKSSTDI